MSDNEMLLLAEEFPTPGRLVLPSLSLSYFATWSPVLVVGLLLLDIGNTFGQSVGMMAQIQTLASLVTAITAVFMGVWSVRYNHRSLLLLGLTFSSLATFGCFMAFNFPMMFISYSIIWGFGLAMVEPMLFTIVGEQFPLEQRARAIGWLMTSLSLIGIIGAPVVGVLAEMGGWRWAFLGFVLPLILLSLVMVVTGVHIPVQKSQILSRHQEVHWEGFKVILTNRSALACLLSSALAMAVYQGLGFFGSSFFRERFLVSIGFASILIFGGGICGVLGSQLGGRIVNWVGRRPLTVLSAFIAGIFTILYTNVDHLWLAITFRFLGFIFLLMMFTASSSLTLEQVPQFRGIMMALNSAACYLGSALGAGIGGLALVLFDYRILGLSLGVLGIVITLIYYLAVIDPTSQKQKKQEPER